MEPTEKYSLILEALEALSTEHSRGPWAVTKARRNRGPIALGSDSIVLLGLVE